MIELMKIPDEDVLKKHHNERLHAMQEMSFLAEKYGVTLRKDRPIIFSKAVTI